jgi:bifunctional non-homologous end joining protein LigD
VGFRGEGGGWRILAYKDGGRVRLVSRNGRDHTRRFAEIAGAVAKLFPHSLVFDGEVAIYAQALRSRFDWRREPDADAVTTPPLLMAFDLLHQDGRELASRPLRDRRWESWKTQKSFGGTENFKNSSPTKRLTSEARAI